MKKSLSQILLLLLTLAFLPASAQKKPAYVSGKVVNENDEPLANVSVIILGQQKGIATNDTGYFKLKVPADKAFALVFSYTGYKTEQQNFMLSEGEQEMITMHLEAGPSTTLEEVIVKDQSERREAGLIRANPKSIINLPSPTIGVENLIYVNDFEIFRPYLVRSGQQEGLSFINPEMVRNINFYNGGFQARYGDKMSSVLDIQYKKPKRFGGSAYISLLEQGFHVEGTTAKNRLTYLIGIRNRSNKNLLSSQETQGSYTPSSDDIQALITWQASDKWQTEILANVSRTRFTLLPQFSQLTSSVFSPFFTQNLGIDIYFEGREQDKYTTGMGGLSATYQPNKNLKLKWLTSRFENDERENIDIAGAYLFGDRDFDKSKSTFGTIINPLGAGLYQNYARNSLKITDYNVSHKGSLDVKKQLVQWGVG